MEPGIQLELKESKESKDGVMKKLSKDALYGLLQVYEEYESGHRTHENFREIAWSVDSDLLPLETRDEDELLFTAIDNLLEDDKKYKGYVTDEVSFRV